MQPTLELLYVPAITVRSISGATVPQYVATLGTPCGTPNDSFEKLCKIVWLASLRCHMAPDPLDRDTDIEAKQLAQRYPGFRRGTLMVNNEPVDNSPGMRERLRLPKTLARTEIGRPLDYPHLVKLLSDNFRVTVSGFEEPAEGEENTVVQTAFFPMIPGLSLTATEQSVTVDFNQHQLRSSQYEDRLDDVLERLLVRYEDTDTGSQPASQRDPLSYATLLFEQYFDRLASLINDEYFELLVVDGSASKTLSEMLDGDFDVGGKQANVNFTRIGAMLTNDFLSGLRLPERFVGDPSVPAGRFEGLYAWSGQQFSITAFDPNNNTGSYKVEVEKSASAPADWLTFGAEKPKTETIDGPELTDFVAQSVPTIIQNTVAINPVEKNPRRFGFAEAYQWDVAETHPSLLQFTSGLQRELKTIRAAILPGDADQRMRLRFFKDVAAVQNEAGADIDSNELEDLRWVTTIPMLIRRVSDTTINPLGGGAPQTPHVKNLYELVGMSEDNRRRLSLLRSDFAAEDGELNLLYPTIVAGETRFKSDPLVSDVNLCNCVVFRTNLTSESAPSTLSLFEASAAFATTDNAIRDVASIAEKADFLRLVEEACIVNGGGYYLFYEPTEASDPLDEVFNELNTDQVQVQILVRFGKTTDEPQVRQHYNGVAGDLHAEATDGTNFVYARIERTLNTGPLVFHPVNEFDSRMAPGSIGFRVTRNRVPNPDPNFEKLLSLDNDNARHYLDNLFSQLSYSVTTPDSDQFRDFVFTLPLRPTDPNANSSHSPNAEVGPWCWDGVLQVLKTPFDTPYVGLGEPLRVDFGFRDVYGNEFPASGAHAAIDLRLRYFDKLISPREWPGLRSEFDVQSGQLVVRLQSNPYNVVESNGMPEYKMPPEQRQEVARRYEQIKRQLTDSNTLASVKIIQENPPVQSAEFIQECKEALILRATIPAPDSPASFLAPVTIELGIPDFDIPADFFAMDVRIEIVRNVDNDLFAQVKEPWDPAPRPFPAAKMVSSQVGLPGVDEGGDPNVPPAARQFATAFETLYQGDHLKLAAGVRDDGSHQWWILRFDRLRPTLRQVVRDVDQADLVYAPRPLDTSLRSRKLTNVPAPLSLPGGTAGTPQDRNYDDVETDMEVRRFLAAVESFLTPSTVRSILCVKKEGNGNTKFGRDSLQAIVSAKRAMSNKLPGQMIDVLYKNSPMPKKCSATSARNAFRQRVLSSLNAAYGLDTILQFDAIAPDGMRAHKEDGGVSWFGEVVDRDEPTEALTYENSKIRFSEPFTESPPRLTLLIDQPHGNLKRPRSRRLGFRLTHFEYKIEGTSGNLNCGVNANYQPSRWLTLINTDDAILPIADETRIDIPIPLREHPDPPRFTSQSSDLSIHREDDPPAATLLNTRLWDYELVYEARMKQQDLLQVWIDLNIAPPSPFAALVSAVDLLTELLHFHAIFPDPNAYYAALRTEGDVDEFKLRFLAEFVQRTNAIANALGNAALPNSASNAFATELRTLSFEIDDFDDAQGCPCEEGGDDLENCRLSRVRWTVDDAETAMMALLEDKRARAAGASAHSEVSVGETTLRDLFNRCDLGEVRRFLLQGSHEQRKLIVAGIPQESEFHQLISEDGPMGFAFSRDERAIVVHWIMSLPPKDMTEDIATIGPYPDNPKKITTAGPGVFISRFREPEPREEDGYRGRLLRVQGINVLQFESSKPRGRLLRNLRLAPPSATLDDPKYDVNDKFVYRTPEVAMVDVHVPRLLVTEPISLRDPSVSAPPSTTLTAHLEHLFATFLNNAPNERAPNRRVRLETRYAFDAAGSVDLGSSDPMNFDSIPISSAQRLLPPTDIPLAADDRVELIELLVGDLSTWRSDYSPSIDGKLQFDLLLYASIVPQDQDRPLLQLKRISLPLSLIESWT